MTLFFIGNKNKNINYNPIPNCLLTRGPRAINVCEGSYKANKFVFAIFFTEGERKKRKLIMFLRPIFNNFFLQLVIQFWVHFYDPFTVIFSLEAFMDKFVKTEKNHSNSDLYLSVLVGTTVYGLLQLLAVKRLIKYQFRFEIYYECVFYFMLRFNMILMHFINIVNNCEAIS